MNKELHEHEHHHDDGCCCGHDHEHEHHHHHDGDCCCGHDHEHDHHEHDHHEHHHVAENIPADHKTKVYTIENLGCANCAAKMESRINQLEEVSDATITFATKQLRVSAKNPDALLNEIQEICAGIEVGVQVVEKKEQRQNTAQKRERKAEQKKELYTIIAGAVLFLGTVLVNEVMGYEDYSFPFFLAFAVSYLILGGEVLLSAGKNILKGQMFDENFLMSIATLGSFAIHKYPEAVGVMLFFRIGEFFEDVAVEKSRSQIMEAVDLRPEVVLLEKDGQITEIPAEEAKAGDIVQVRPGDRIPLDGVVIEGESRIDTSAVTGEPVPVAVREGSEAVSGCVNISGLLRIRVEKPLEESMVSRILNSVENAAAGKPKIDHFITRFARVYTPIVVALALFTAIAIPIIGVVKPGAKVAAQTTQNGKIGVIGTEGTIRSEIYTKTIHRENKDAQVMGRACPLFVPLVEEGWIKDPVTVAVAERYLQPFKESDIDTLILGCTHYPLLRSTVREIMGEGVNLVNPAYETAVELRRLLAEQGIANDGKTKDGEEKYQFYVSDAAEKFMQFANSILPYDIEQTQLIPIEEY